LNCALAALHAHVTSDAGYALEDKWTFLHEARQAGIAVSPWWDVSPEIIVKHRNMEGNRHCVFCRNAWDSTYKIKK